MARLLQEFPPFATKQPVTVLFQTSFLEQLPSSPHQRLDGNGMTGGYYVHIVKRCRAICKSGRDEISLRRLRGDKAGG